MRIQVSDESIKAVVYYVSEAEAADKELMASLSPKFKEWKQKGYFSAVIESGKGSLEDAMYILMKHHIELKAKKRVKARNRDRER